MGKPEAVVRVLTRGYRVPSEILDVANRLLPDLAPLLPPATSVRPGRGSVSVHRVADVAPALPAILTGVLDHAGSVGVIVSDADLPVIAAALAAAGVSAARLSTTDPDDAADEADVPVGTAAGSPRTTADRPVAERITVLPASLAKGLEFDHVVLVEPAAIVAAEDRGLHRLYVALTRAVTSLTVVHSQPLPHQLDSSTAA